MTDLLGIGASAVATYRNALSVVGENVANAETPGYARRDVTIQQSAAVGGTIPYFKGGISAGGSDATGVTRAWDSFKSADALAATADDGRASAASTWLDAAEGAISDGDAGVGAKISAVFTGANVLAADPTSAVARTQMFNALGDAAGAVSGAAKNLATVSAGITDAASTAVKGANDSLAALARVNTQIARAPDGNETKAALADQRDQLLSNLSGSVGIDSRIASDGTATISLSGSSGTTLLTGGKAAILGMSAATDGRLAFTVGFGNDVTTLTPTSGSLAGLGEAASGVAGSRSGLDAIAASFAQQMNGFNAAGTTASGAAGQPLFSITGGAASLSLVATSGTAIAAASADGTANGNLLTLSDLRGSDGVEARMANLVGVNAQTLSSVKAQASAAATRKSTALDARDATAGVSLDQEATDLVRYQQAYAGSAKIIQAAQTTLQSILALF